MLAGPEPDIEPEEALAPEVVHPREPRKTPPRLRELQVFSTAVRGVGRAAVD
jgi:hypothetical protein